jgi:hypothetical protein
MGTVAARETLPLAAIARVAAEDFLRSRQDLKDLKPALADELTGAIELALLTAVRAERRACVAECTRRGDLWRRTADAPSTTEPARLEAEHRANEAIVLADLLATRT